MLSSKKLYYNQIRTIYLFSRLLNKPVNHYDSLGVTRRATQSEIKGAYYKLSMLYHPDKNSGGDEAAQKFRDITAAYEVLGNIKLRKLYDKGMLRHHPGPDGPESEDDAQTKFYKQHVNRAKPPPPTGRTPIYNFDEWSKSHYAHNFNKKLKSKEQMERIKRYEQMRSNADKSEHIIIGFTLLSVLVFILSFQAATDNYDISEMEIISEQLCDINSLQINDEK